MAIAPKVKLTSATQATLGADDIDEMLDKKATVIPRLETATLESLETMDIKPDGVRDDQSIQFAQTCGSFKFNMRPPQVSGFTDAIMHAHSAPQRN